MLRTHQRKPTPCTRPRTQAVSLACLLSGSASGPDGSAPTVSIPVVESGHQRPRRGRGWHFGQLKDDRFMNLSRRTAVPQRGHGCPARP